MSAASMRFHGGGDIARLGFSDEPTLPLCALGYRGCHNRYADVSCYGRLDFATPNLERIAADGMRFPRA
jgi:hypothetical protein